MGFFEEEIERAVVLAHFIPLIISSGGNSGSMILFLLQKLGLDPASSSAPFVATLVDVTGLLIFFSIAVSC